MAKMRVKKSVKRVSSLFKLYEWTKTWMRMSSEEQELFAVIHGTNSLRVALFRRKKALAEGKPESEIQDEVVIQIAAVNSKFGDDMGRMMKMAWIHFANITEKVVLAHGTIVPMDRVEHLGPTPVWTLRAIITLHEDIQYNTLSREYARAVRRLKTLRGEKGKRKTKRP